MTVLLVKRFNPPMPPTPEAGEDGMVVDVIATIQLGEIEARVERLSYWECGDGDRVSVLYQAKVDGLPNSDGLADIVAEDPEVLLRISAVTAGVARILREVR